ncbi:MAG: TonB-dependent receptor [Gammaproteobacteria bacterium]|nr:TonB-dependent receptor [Gammaproteobacteria bacterium]
MATRIYLSFYRAQQACLATAVACAAMVLAGIAWPVHGEASGPTGEPIMVIDRTSIELSGLTTLSQLLSSRSAFNVFGINGLSSAIGGAYLVDGRPVTGLDFSTFPLSSVERIELWEEGATHFSGHIGDGTINIVRRRAFEGTEVLGGLGRPDSSGMDFNAGSALWGGPMGAGRIVVGVDHVFGEEVRDSERSYTRTKFTDSLAGSQGVSIAGNTLFVGDDSYALGDCDPSVYTGPLKNGTGEACGYPYSDIAWFAEYPRTQRESVFAHADLALGENTEIYLDVLWARSRTRYTWAPPPGTFTFDVPPGSPIGSALEAALPGLVISSDDSVTLAHRFVGHGNRGWRWDWDDRSFVVGMRGQISEHLGYDAHVRHYREHGLEQGKTFVSEELAKAVVLSGEYDFLNPLSTEPAHLEAIHRTSVHSRQSYDQEITVIHTALDGTALALPGGPIRWTAVFEFEDYAFRDVVHHRDFENREYEATEVLGSSGSSVKADRHVKLAQAAASLPVLPGLEVVLTGRLRDYDDIGSTTAWRAAGHYRANDALSLRLHTDYSEFSPGVRQLYESERNSFPWVRDCKAYIENPEACVEEVSVLQVKTEDVGNPNLETSKANTVGIGATLRLGPMYVAADWYRQKIWNRSSRPSVQHLVDLENRDQELPDGAQILRVGGSETGAIEKIVRPLSNHRDNDGRSQGIAWRAGADWETAWALLDLDINYLRTIDSYSRVEGVKQPGDFPSHRAHVVLRAVRGDWSASWNAHSRSGYYNAARTGRWGSWSGHDLALQWRRAYGMQGLELTAGVLNVDDRKPSLNPANPNNPALDYDSTRGRTYFVSASFGW